MQYYDIKLIERLSFTKKKTIAIFKDVHIFG